MCDNVIRHQVVLANGSIVTASKDENSDLWLALKGGSNNFGIVTRYDFSAFEGGPIFGGVVTYPGTTAEKQLQAILNFGDNIEKVRKRRPEPLQCPTMADLRSITG